MVEVDRKIDVKQRLAALNRTLAEATMACPCEGCNRAGLHWVKCIGGCQGAGEVACFPGFRLPELCAFCGGACRPPPEGDNSPCEDCADIGLQGGVGRLEDALASLSVLDTLDVLRNLSQWVWQMEDGPMPDGATILVKALELVCEAAGLEVPDAR